MSQLFYLAFVYELSTSYHLEEASSYAKGFHQTRGSNRMNQSRRLTRKEERLENAFVIIRIAPS